MESCLPSRDGCAGAGLNPILLTEMRPRKVIFCEIQVLETVGKIIPMRIAATTVLLTMLSAPGFAQQPAQQPGAAPSQSTSPAPTQNAAQKPVQDAAVKPSALLQPALDALEQAIGVLKVEKWKGGSVRAEAGTNVSSIMRDLQSTLPPMLKEADAAPGTMSKVLPVSRNIDALYDVVLRVVDSASVSAPGEQLAPLQDAMTGLSKARHALDDRILDMAAAREKQIGDLQVALKNQPAPVCPVAPPPPPPPAPKKAAPKKKKPKPATPPAATTTQPAPAKPNQ